MIKIGLQRAGRKLQGSLWHSSVAVYGIYDMVDVGWFIV